MTKTAGRAPGRSQAGRHPPGGSVGALGGRGARGFTLIELMIVVALIAIASAVASLALRDPAATQLEREAVRLAALLESARAEARASGLAVTWTPGAVDAGPAGLRPADGSDDATRVDFRFTGLPPSAALPQRWLAPGVSAEVVGARSVPLGPEPLIGTQRIVLSLNDRRLTLATDGLGPFAVVDGGAAP